MQQRKTFFPGARSNDELSAGVLRCVPHQLQEAEPPDEQLPDHAQHAPSAQ